MKWASRVSEHIDLDQAVEECVRGVLQDLGQAEPNLAVVFVSVEHASDYDLLPRLIKKHLGPALLFGCSGGGVLGGGQEVENRPGLSLTVANLPDVDIGCFHLEADDLPDMDASPDSWQQAVGISPQGPPGFVLLVDPFTFPAANFVLGMDYAYPGSVKVGGLASGGRHRGGNALYLGDRVYTSGAVGLSLRGNIVLDTVVAQGCRPVGSPMRITNCRDNVLMGLDGEPPLKVLRELYESLDERDRELMRHSLFLGVVMDEFQEDPQQGDFLIRNIIGTDSQSGAIAVGEILREGQIVQLHLRDALTSREDLIEVLGRYMTEHGEASPQGGLLFSCLGRGQYLYGRPNHDTELFGEKLGPVPLGGFFCNGEIGPVGGTTFLHGYTSSFGLVRPVR